jgi:hypothetical protein
MNQMSQLITTINGSQTTPVEHDRTELPPIIVLRYTYEDKRFEFFCNLRHKDQRDRLMNTMTWLFYQDVPVEISYES